MRAVLTLLFCLSGCGGAPPPSGGEVDEELASLPDPSRASLQLYLVLTNERSAMQTKDEVDAMWRAVGGEGPRYQAVRRHVRWVPGSYELDVTLDFADLPHPAVSLDGLRPLLASLPPAATDRALGAKLALFVRSRAGLLPEGNHIRLAGLAALYAADTHGGIIIDLIGRRAWTPDDWQAELAGRALSKRQLRLSQRPDGDKRWLLTRGNPKYAAPDLQMRGIDRGRIGAARALFVQVQEALVVRGGTAGQRLPGPDGRQVTLKPCEAPPGLFDAECVQIDPP